MIEVNRLCKSYESTQAVNNISFQVHKNTVCGLIGPNGSGKSTTLNMLTGCLEPSSGSIMINGISLLARPKAAKQCIGYLPEQPPLYPDITPKEQLAFSASLRGMNKSDARKEIERVTAIVDLGSMANRLNRFLSKGYRQRVGIAQVLLGDPQIIVLDEPGDGLDPSQQIEIRELIRQIGREHTVLMSSHALSEVSSICDRVLVLSGGTIHADGTAEDLAKQVFSSSVLQLRIKADPEKVKQCLDKIQGMDILRLCLEQNGSVTAVEVSAEKPDELCEKIFFLFSGANLPILQMNLHRPELEEIFMKLVNNCSLEDDPPMNMEVVT